VKAFGMMTRSQWWLRVGRLAGVGALCLALVVGLVFLARAATARTSAGAPAASGAHRSCAATTASPRAAPAASALTTAPNGKATAPAALATATSVRATAPATDGATGWAQFGYDTQGRRCNPNESSLSVHTASKLDLAWSNTTAPFIESSPVVAHGVLYVASDNPHTALSAFNASTGAVIWSQVLPNVVETATTSPAVANGAVFVGAADTLYAFDATTGRPLWSKATGNILQGWPVVDAGLVYISSQDGNVYALRQATGAPAWTAPLALGGEPAVATTALAIAGGLLYIGAGQSLYAFDATTGHLVWRIAAPGGLSNSAPVVGDGIIYIGGFDGRLYALNAETGASLWSALTGNVINGSAAVAYGLVYIGSGDGVIYAYHATTGKLAWKRNVGGVIFTSDAVANGVVYATTACDCGADPAKFLFALDAATGAILWNYAPGYPVYSSPTVADGYLYASAYTGLFAFHA